ncbi:hypothetical protein P4159_09865 [Bacillus thuringiensis]|uniref:hypothetical protein n=1 Tax=Bacillus thuringiensis TaxID=1428 RepID=UPI0007C180BE|nr:hypothetical protein [Bacillus thuringiensis]AND10419.1 hypothetical protein Bt4C1_25490 [Bacillus thuringiensis serovar alesti]MEC3596268.1 hypothetical protein [Bacillus thuringiensis]MED1832123.1 hypothetical protein [Bacillus thuringiensis]MED2208084.1 hypothetical protein [Bacillus thuringiensis]MED2668394.1 hypothetical protein [Bacillus thuringiensis]
MSNHEKEHDKNKDSRPLVVADVHEFADKWFLIAVMYEEGHVVANIVTPLHQLVEEGGTIPNKLREIVLLNSRQPSENMAFDVMTNTSVIYGELLKESEILCLLVEAEKTTETKRTIDNPHVQECILGLLEEDEQTRLQALVEARANRSVAETKAAAAQVAAEAMEITKKKGLLFGRMCDWFAKVWRGLKV